MFTAINSFHWTYEFRINNSPGFVISNQPDFISRSYLLPLASLLRCPWLAQLQLLVYPPESSFLLLSLSGLINVTWLCIKRFFLKWKFSSSFILWLEKKSSFVKQAQNVCRIGCASYIFSWFSVASVLILSFMFAQNPLKLLKPVMVLH